MTEIGQEPKIWSAVLVTAIIVGGGTYFIANADSPINDEISEVSLTKSSKDYAIMGRQFWSAFECSTLASFTSDVAEAERLFNFGHARGSEFLAAAMAGKIENTDVSSEVPIAVTMLVQGPSNEFILGRIYEAAQEAALDEVFKTDGEYNSQEMQQIIANNDFREKNCQLIGK